MKRQYRIEEGVVDAIFAHRFVLRRRNGSRLLADLGPRGAEAYTLCEGAEVTIEGEAKLSELKVAIITPRGGPSVVILHGKPHDQDWDNEAATAIAAAAKLGVETLGATRRKPRHVEVLARRGGTLVEVHVEHDGTIRKEKPADIEKWADALPAAA